MDEETLVYIISPQTTGEILLLIRYVGQNIYEQVLDRSSAWWKLLKNNPISLPDNFFT